MKNTFKKALALSASAILMLLACEQTVHAHGFVGDRFFPATVSTDDPLVADELAFPIFSIYTNPGDDSDPESQQITTGFEFDKVIFPKFAIGISDNFLWQKPDGESSVNGFDNLSISGKYEVWRNDEHEMIISIGLDTDLGGTGNQGVGADSFTTFTPNFFIGKGMGDLPDTLRYAKPFAVTAVLGQSLPTEASPNTFNWGIAVEYNIPYLEQHVTDLGLPAPLKDIIPIIEFSMQTQENGDSRGSTTGTINPGILYESKYFQLGVEALIPVGKSSGEHVGAIIQCQLYIDDIFPQVFGSPLFFGDQP